MQLTISRNAEKVRRQKSQQYEGFVDIFDDRDDDPMDLMVVD